MEKFKFSGHASSWPDWFDDFADKGKVRINIDVKQACDDEDDWREYRTYVAILWMPDKIVVAYEGDTIVNHGAYCELEQNGL